MAIKVGSFVKGRNLPDAPLMQTQHYIAESDIWHCHWREAGVLREGNFHTEELIESDSTAFLNSSNGK